MTTTTTDEGPRAWVGCLACYNEGRLTGDWVEAVDAPDFTPCHRPGHEEWWVLDHDGYEGLLTGECSPDEAGRVGELHDALTAAGVSVPLFVEWCDNLGTAPALDELEAFTDAYAGAFDSLEDWAWDELEGMGMLAALPEWAQTHAGALVASWASDERLGGSVWTTRRDGLVHVFRVLA